MSDNLLMQNGKVVILRGGGTPTEEKTVALDMASGDQTISPTSGYTMSQVTVTKPATLIASNIKKDVEIGGVTGTYEGGGISGFYTVTFISENATYQKIEVKQGDSIYAVPAPTKTGEYFANWQTSGGSVVTFPYTPTQDVSFYATFLTWSCTVSNLGSSSPSSVTFTHTGTMPTLEEVVVGTNTFIRIPTMYRKVNSYSSSQITSFTISTSKVDSTYEPYSVFVKEDGSTVMDYVLMGKYFSNSTSTMNSVDTTVATQTLSNARTNARALGTGYQQYDWQFQRLWQDLLICKMQTVNTNSGSGITYDQLGFYWSSNGQWIDGIVQNSGSWVLSYKPTNYVDSATSSTTGYTSAGYSAPTTSNEIQKLGYDSSNGFFNYPSAVYSDSNYATYYCDQYYYSSGNYPVYSYVGSSGARPGAFYCGTDYVWSFPRSVRLCYRPL